MSWRKVIPTLTHLIIALAFSWLFSSLPEGIRRIIRMPMIGRKVIQVKIGKVIVPDI
jgi:hypothetical protein